MSSPPAERPPTLRDRQRAQVRADIHAAAYRLFAARGFGNVTTDDIAAEASVSPRTFFRHVATKEDLLLGAVQRGNAAIASLLVRRPRDEAPDAALAAAIVSRVGSFEDVDFAFQRWVRNRGDGRRPLAADVAEALAVVAHPRWSG
ncbi:MAG: TetR family transcriptional regulator [Mycolicibacterium aromaticivorans]|nr:TetR family transcriptional regulator [Mycolicibacterium aromaticivorans]